MAQVFILCFHSGYTRAGAVMASIGKQVNEQMQGLFHDMVMDQAIKDKLKGHETACTKMAEAAQGDGTAAPAAQEQVEEEEGDDDIMAIRARRLQQMKAKAKEKEANLAKGHGDFQEIEEQDFLKSVTESKKALVHFYSRDFERCKIMDHHLGKLAPRCLGTRFVKLNAEKAPFFVSKLQVRTLPTVAIFEDGVLVHRLVGFQEMGNSDEFPTSMLYGALAERGAVTEELDFDDEPRKEE
mmetsp:Transcript_55975/g.149267  ORF Transcript_55975/g.149267 Transcript_55975/m.149267 type:complete len:240 (+) Transcript_55975:3-722(+)